MKRTLRISVVLAGAVYACAPPLHAGGFAHKHDAGSARIHSEHAARAFGEVVARTRREGAVPVGESVAHAAYAVAGRDAAAQQQAGPRDGADDAYGAQLRVYLMTMGPGDQVWERFGHNALWVSDPLRGEDVAYNYGVFSFDQPGFVRRFLLGRMLYAMQPEDPDYMVRAYIYLNRSVWLQELDLSPRQKLALKEYLEWNALPQNREYLYDYFRDNCSTRIRDVLDHVLGGELRAALERTPTGASYRSHSLRLTHDDVPVSTGLLLAMGHPVDRPLDAWQESFIPMQLSERIEQVQIRGDDGALRPLVSSRTTLFEATREPPPASPPRRTAAYLLAGVLLAAAIAGLGRAAPDWPPRRRTPDRPQPLNSPDRPQPLDSPDATRHLASPDALPTGRRAAFAIVAVLWCAVLGLFGTIIVLLWAATDHAATYWNENVLQANPLGLLLAVAIALGIGRSGRGRRAAFLFAALAAALSVLGLVLKLLPGFSQANAPILALLVPPHLALLFALYPWRRHRSSAKEDGELPRSRTDSVVRRA